MRNARLWSVVGVLLGALMGTPQASPPVFAGAPQTGVVRPTSVVRFAGRGQASAPQTVPAAQAESSLPAQTAESDAALLDAVQRRAFQFFWENADPQTGLVNDRARNVDKDNYTVASIASTGYALAALPIGVERGWLPAAEAKDRAQRTLQFLVDKMPAEHGWFYHFVDKRTGARVWQCEVSSIDTALLVIGALTCGQYFPKTEVARLADTLYDRLDWTWMRTNGGTKPDKQILSHGWKPEQGFLAYDWGAYSEGMLLYMLGLGARHGRLPAASWDAWSRKVVEYGGMQTLALGPLFLHQMAYIYYNFKDQRDRLGYDYWVSATNATRINRQVCLERTALRKTYGPDIWGLSACDGPKGYRAYGVPSPEDGTIASTAALTSIFLTPDLALAAAQALSTRHRQKLWGRYGFGDAFNVDADWYDPDVIGIDLGMALLAIENYRTGLIWRLLASHPSTAQAFAAAGFHATHEPLPRPLQIEKVPLQKAPERKLHKTLL